DISNQADAHCLRQTILQLLQALIFGARFERPVSGNVPVLPHFDISILQLQDVARRELLDIYEGRQGIRDVTEIEVLHQSPVIDLLQRWRSRQDGFDLRPKEQAPVLQRVVERFDAKPVPPQQQALATLVVQRESEHPPEFMDTVCSEVLVEVNDDLGIRVGVEAVPPALEFRTKPREVVNLTVEDHPDAFVFVMHGLVTASQIDDTQPSHSETDAILRVNAFVVRTAVNDRLAHPMDDLRLNHGAGVRTDNTRNPAHR